jgi:hypothetical protein
MPKQSDDESNRKIILSGHCTIEAAAAEEGKPAKLPRITMEAYNGGKMYVRYWGNIVVDLAGMKTSDVVPILYAHSTHSIDDIVGQTDKINADKTLTATGAVMGSSETVKSMLGLAKNGFKFQLSIGNTPTKTREVPEGEEVEVNGQTISGPFTLISESILDEISILPLGADKSTSAVIAAQHEEKERKMNKEDKSAPTAEEIRAAAVAEESRIRDVRSIAKDHPEISASAVKDGWDITKTELAVKDATIKAQAAEIAAHKIQDERPNVPGINSGAKPKMTATAIEAATAIRAGLKNAEKAYGPDTMEAASVLEINSMTDLVRHCLAASGKPLTATRHQTKEFLQAAFSTASISNVLSNVANKFIRQGFGTVEETWRQVSSVRSVVDFKANTGVRLVMSNLLQGLAPTGEIQHGSLSDETRSIQADTKALMIAISRQDIINDDLGVLTDVPVKLGFAAARTFNTDFWAAFTDALATAFPTDDSLGNYHNVALSLANLALAEQKFMGLVDSDGNPIGADASVLLVGSSNSVLARELFLSTNLIGGTSKSTGGNPFVGRYSPAATRYITGAGWALVANPMAVPMMEAAFLNGRQEPWVETADTDFNTLGIQMRCWYDYGVAFAEPKAAVYSAGG